MDGRHQNARVRGRESQHVPLCYPWPLRELRKALWPLFPPRVEGRGRLSSGFWGGASLSQLRGPGLSAEGARPPPPAGLRRLPRDPSTRRGARALRPRPRPPPGRCHSLRTSRSVPAPPPLATQAVASTRLSSGNQGGDPFKRANGIPGDPLRENRPPPRPPSPSRSPARPAAAGALPDPRGRLEGRGSGPCEPASKRGDAGPAPAPRRRAPAPSPAAPARRPGLGPRSPAAPGREGEAAAAAALTIAGRQALPGARVPMARTQGLGFTSIPFCPAPPFPGPPLLRRLPVFPRLPLAWPRRVPLSSLSSFPRPRSPSSPPPPPLQKERKG